MTDNIREKTRAVFLAAIMVLSVVAMTATFAGGAVAVDQTGGDAIDVTDVSVSPSTPGDSAEYSITTNVSSAANGNNITVDGTQNGYINATFSAQGSGGFDTADASNVQLLNDTGDEIAANVSTSGGEINFEITNNETFDLGDDITISFDGVTNPDAGQYTVTVEAFDNVNGETISASETYGIFDGTEITDLEISNTDQTVLSSPIDNSYIGQEIDNTITERSTDNFSDSPNLAPDAGLLGVPYQESPYDGFTDDSFSSYGPVTQNLTVQADVSDTDGETEEITIDYEEAVDAGVTVETLDGFTEEQHVTVTSGASQITVDDVRFLDNTGEIVIEYSASQAVSADFEVITRLVAEDVTAGLDVDVSERLDVFVEGPAGDLEDDRFRLVDNGVIGIHESDLAGVDTNGDNEADGADLEALINAAEFENAGTDGDVSYNVWTGEGGSVVTFQTTGASNTEELTLYEVTRNNDGNVTGVDEVSGELPGTSPGNTTAVDMSTLPDPDSEYFIGFGEDETELAYFNLQALDLTAQMADDQVSTEDQVQVNVDSNDESATNFSGSVQAWYFEAGDDPVPSNVIHVEQGELDGDGVERLRASPQADLAGTGEYYAVVLHDESQIVAQTDTIEVTEPLRERVDIESPQFGDQYKRGDIAEFELSMQNVDTATVTLGDRAGDQNFELNITVRDTNEDGTARFMVNTFQLGDGPVAGNQSAELYQGVEAGDWESDDGREYPHGVLTTDDGTSIVETEAHPSIRIGGGSNNNSDIRVVIADGGYDLVASPGDTAASEPESRATDRSQLRLQPRTTEGVDVWSAPAPDDPAEVEDFETVDEIATAIDNETITPQDGSLADEDFLIVQAQSTGLEGVLATVVEEEVATQDVEDFLDRSEDHEVTEAFTTSDLVELRTTQNLTQVRQIVSDALDDQSRNLPEDQTFALPAQLDLLAANDNQKVLAGTDDLGSLNEYFIMTPVSNTTVADLIDVPAGSDDVPQDVDAYTDDEIEAVVDIHPNYEPSDFGDGDDDLEGDHDDVRQFFEDNSEFEIPTNQPPTRFNTTFELAPNVDDDEAENFPLNDFFAGDSGETLVNWELVEDEVSLDNLETILEDEERIDRLFLPPRDNYEVTGETEIAAGTTLEHDTQSDVGETPPFFESGSFQVEYVQGGPNDISFVINETLSERAGQAFTMNIRRANAFGLVTPDEQTIEGQITEPAEVIEHTFEDQEGGGEVVNVASVNVSTAGAVQIQNANGDVLGQQLLEEGLNENVRVLLDTPIEESQELTSVIVTSAGEEFDEGPTNQTAQYTVAGGQATFDVSNLNPVATTVEPGQGITVTADVTNSGDVSANTTVELRLDGETLDSQEVTLEPDGSQEVSFTVNAPDSTGDYAHSVWTENDDAVGQLTVEEAGGMDDDTGNATDTGDEGDSADDGGAGFGVAAALIALLGAALLAYRRRAE
jgi:surface glycoprotein (TIGR04207 family)/PGF-CTERM protein